jgi:RNA polymerase sigma-70 factor (ECF subfamily)
LELSFPRNASHREGRLTNANSDEALLVSRLQSGDESAFLALYRRHQSPVYRFALRMSGSEPVAEDVTQDTFLALIRGLGGFDPQVGSLRGYLFGTARNLVYRHFGVNRGQVPLDEESGAPEFVSDRDPLAELSRAERTEQVRQALLALPLHYREVVVFCEMDEMSYAEAAEVLGCSVGTIRSRLSRGRALLLEKLTALRVKA